MKDDFEIREKFKQFLEKGEPPLDYGKQLLEGDLNKKRVLAILQGKVVPPYEVEIQPSSTCNLNCKHCFGREYSHLVNKIGKMEFDVIAKKINEFQENGFKIETVKFCGTTGEPLVNPATLYGIELFKDLGKKVIVFTNGLALDRPIGITGLKYYDIVGKADKVNLSLDAGSEEMFFDLKGRHGFWKIIHSLEELTKIRDTKNKGLDLRVSYVIGDKNYSDVSEATRIVKDSGANEIVFRVDFTNPEKTKELFQDITSQIKEAKKYKSDNFNVVSTYSDEDILGVGECSAFNTFGRKCFNHNFWACIGPDAELYACGHRTHAGVKSYGNLLENSFKDIWISKERGKAVRELPDDYCKNCSPSSRARNDFMTFLSNLKEPNREELVTNPEKDYSIKEKQENIVFYDDVVMPNYKVK